MTALVSNCPDQKTVLVKKIANTRLATGPAKTTNDRTHKGLASKAIARCSGARFASWLSNIRT